MERTNWSRDSGSDLDLLAKGLASQTSFASRESQTLLWENQELALTMDSRISYE
jgi:hypothetical protein